MSNGCFAPCSRAECKAHGCVLARLHQPWNLAFPPVGCICPPTSEATCRNPSCPRKPLQPMTATSTTGAAP